jgi:hypothetical protein
MPVLVHGHMTGLGYHMMLCLGCQEVIELVCCSALGCCCTLLMHMGWTDVLQNSNCTGTSNLTDAHT